MIFKTQTEQSLTNLINGIEGVGNASVLVTIEKSSEQVYATEEKTSTQNTARQEYRVQQKISLITVMKPNIW